MQSKVILIFLLCFCQTFGTQTDGKPSEESLQLARELVSLYQNQEKQFYPYFGGIEQYYPRPQHHQSKLEEVADQEDLGEPTPRNPELPALRNPTIALPKFLEGSLDPWIQEDDSISMESIFSSDYSRNDPVEEHSRVVTQCGVAQADRIVGGQDTQRGEFPWMAALQLSWGFQFCGGALINEKFVLTASHCLSWGKDVLKSRVLLGGYNLNEESGAIYRNVKKIKLHIKYNSTTTDNDVALIELDKPVPIGGPIQTICLPDNSTSGDLVGQDVVVAGWGKLSESGKTSSVLKKVTVSVISNDVCKYMYSPNEITPQMLCAGDPKGGKDACQGDSGGPLMKQNSKKQWTQVGIVSFGIGCGQPKFPGVYTRLSMFTDWITRHSKY